MARTIILPTGISIKRKLQPHGVTIDSPAMVQTLRAQGVEMEALSAELATLRALGACQDDEVIFLATDTDDAEEAAKANARIAESVFGVGTAAKRITDLVLDAAERFKRKGIPALVAELERHVSRAVEHGREPWLSVSGGIKSVVPYVAIYGMLRRVPVTYIFEMTEDLVTLPPLPIDFDWAGLRAAERVLDRIEQDVAVRRDDLRQLLGENFPRMEGLFEEYEGGMTLSAFGHLLLAHLKRAREMPVILSPSAKRKLDESSGTQRQLIELILDRVRNPLWRAQKLHAFQGTDLDVYKPGSTAHRLAGWVERVPIGGGQVGETVYVAEIYTRHDEYERDLPNRRRRDYSIRDFTPHDPSALDVGTEEESGDELIALVFREKVKAEADRDEALSLATRMEEERNESRERAESSRRDTEKYRQEADGLRTHLAAVETRQREMGSWNVWRRLWWALFSL